MKKYVLVIAVLVVAMGNCVFAQENKVTITFWDGMSQPCELAIRSIISDFEEIHPNIHVEHVKVSFGAAFEKVTMAVAGWNRTRCLSCMGWLSDSIC